AELRGRYARKSAEGGDGRRYARERFETAERLASEGETLFADGAYGRAAAAFEESIARFKACETAAAQGKQEEAVAVEARRGADDARRRATEEKAPERAAERWAAAERAFERGKKAQDDDLAFDLATIAFKEAAAGYDD